MRVKFPTITKNGLCAIAVVVMAMVVILMATCRHKGETAPVDDARRASIDSLLATIDDVDSLEVMIRQFAKVQDDLGEMLTLKRQGRLLRNQARFEQAISANMRGLNIATQLADTLEMCELLNNLGICSRRMGDMSGANGYHYQSLKLLETFSLKDDDESMLAKSLTLNGIGNIEYKLCHYKMADSLLHEAMDCEFRVGRNEGVAINACDLGMIKGTIGQIDSAWFYLNKAMEQSRHGQYKKGEALCHMRMGELHEQEQRFSHAMEEYKLAYGSFKDLEDSWHLQQTCLDMARVSILLDESEDAHRFLHEAEAEALNTGCKANLAEAHQIHYELSLLQGDIQEALRNYTRSMELFDSIYGLEKGEEMRTQRIEYQNWVKNSEMDVLNRDISHLKRLRIIHLLLMLLLVLMAATVIAALTYVIRERMRTQHLMRQVEETRSLFFTNVVHLLRTPLTAIMGAVDDITAEAATMQGTNGNYQKNAGLIERQGKNLLTLMDRILEVGSVRSAVTQLDWSAVDGVTYLRMLLDTYLERCAERHIELTYNPHETSAIIDTVPRYLDTIVRSLIDNAINYSRNYSQISVTSRVDDKFFVIRVADNGMGIDPNDLPHVFEPFYRGAAAEQLMDGVGIGLTVVRDMTMALGGTVDIESVKEGTVVTVKLPCRYSKKGISSKLDKLIPQAQTTTYIPHSHEKLPTVKEVPSRDGLPVILVVEDNADVARLVGTILSKEYAVYYAQDGERGLAMACEHVPDLVITDVKMPLMDGYEFTERIRATEGLRHIPVIILSARISDEARVRGIKAGANAYLVKPFVKEELLAWVENLLQSRPLTKQPDDQKDKVMAKPVLVTQGEDDRFLECFAQAVDRQMSCGDKLDLDKLALTFKMGESQLKRKIHDLTGKTLTAYITQLRMEKALRLLCQDPDMLIGDVAVECGFADVAYFSRVFRQYYGKTPTQARNDHQNQ